MIAWYWLIPAGLIGFCLCALLAGVGVSEAQARADNWRLHYDMLASDHAALQKAAIRPDNVAAKFRAENTFSWPEPPGKKP